MKKLLIAMLLGSLMFTGCGKENTASDVTDTLVESSESVESTADMETSEEDNGTQESETVESSEADTEETEESTESVKGTDQTEETESVETDMTEETPAPTEDVESGETEETKESAEPTKEPDKTPKPEKTPKPMATPTPTPEPTPAPTPTPEVHVHNYVTTTRWEASCNPAKAVWDVCSCGAYINAHDEGEPLGHTYAPDDGTRNWFHEPTCLSKGSYTKNCLRCNSLVVIDNDAPLGHDFEDTIINPDRDCKSPAEIKHHCKRCGRDEWTVDWTNLGEHVYVECVERDYVNHEWIETPTVKCKTCAKHPDE